MFVRITVKIIRPFVHITLKIIRTIVRITLALHLQQFTLRDIGQQVIRAAPPAVEAGVLRRHGEYCVITLGGELLH